MANPTTLIAATLMGASGLICAGAIVWKLASPDQRLATAETKVVPPPAVEIPESQLPAPQWKSVGTTHLVRVKTERDVLPEPLKPNVDWTDVPGVEIRLTSAVQACGSGSLSECDVAGWLCEHALSPPGFSRGEFRNRWQAERHTTGSPEPQVPPLVQVAFDHCWVVTGASSKRSRPLPPDLGRTLYLQGQRETDFDLVACERGSDGHCHRSADRRPEGGQALSVACDRGDLTACRRGAPPAAKPAARYSFSQPSPLSFKYAVERAYVLEQCLESGQRDACPMPDSRGLRALSLWTNEVHQVGLRVEAEATRHQAEKAGCEAGDARKCVLASQSARIRAPGREPDARAALRFAERACQLDARTCETLADLHSGGIGVAPDPRAAATYFRQAAAALEKDLPIDGICPTDRPAAIRCAGAYQRYHLARQKAARHDPELEKHNCRQGERQACGLLVGLAMDAESPTHDAAALGRDAALKLRDLCQHGDQDACILPDITCRQGDLAGCSYLASAPGWLVPNAPDLLEDIVKKRCPSADAHDLICAEPDRLLRLAADWREIRTKMASKQAQDQPR